MSRPVVNHMKLPELSPELNLSMILEAMGLIITGVTIAIFSSSINNGYDLESVLVGIQMILITAVVAFAILYFCSVVLNKSKLLALLLPFILIGLLGAFILLQSSAG